jgi:hypothetical protein
MESVDMFANQTFSDLPVKRIEEANARDQKPLVGTILQIDPSLADGNDGYVSLSAFNFDLLLGNQALHQLPLLSVLLYTLD